MNQPELSALLVELQGIGNRVEEIAGAIAIAMEQGAAFAAPRLDKMTQPELQEVLSVSPANKRPWALEKPPVAARRQIVLDAARRLEADGGRITGPNLAPMTGLSDIECQKILKAALAEGLIARTGVASATRWSFEGIAPPPAEPETPPQPTFTDDVEPEGDADDITDPDEALTNYLKRPLLEIQPDELPTVRPSNLDKDLREIIDFLGTEGIEVLLTDRQGAFEIDGQSQTPRQLLARANTILIRKGTRRRFTLGED